MKTKRECGSVLLQWHGSQGDPIYAVGSYFISDMDYPNLTVVESAAIELDKLRTLPPNLVETGYHVELKEAAEFLRNYVKERTAQRPEGSGV